MIGTVEDAHWAPPQIVLAKRLLTHAGHLQVAWDSSARVGSVVPHDGPPLGQVRPDRQLPAEAGVFALVEAGVVRYVGHADHLARAFGPRGLGRPSPKDCQDAGRAEDCRLHRLVVRAAAEGRVVDVYLLLEPRAPRHWWQRREPGRRATALADDAQTLAAATRGAWQSG